MWPIMMAGLKALLRTVRELLGMLASIIGRMIWLLIELRLLMTVWVLCESVLAIRC